MTTTEIKITTNRIPVLIGKGGKTKRDIEKKTATKLTIDSDDGLVGIEGGEDAIAVLRTTEMVRAINRGGFSPERAATIFEDEDMMLDILDLSSVCNTPKQMERLRGGRIIGKEGRAREQIEDMSGAILSVQGKTVAIIGMIDQVRNARTAVEMLVEGLPHATVFSFLDRKKKEAKFDMLDYYY
ncbi:pre-rRNA-processing protein PNO1 [Methanogenium cariaci]|uniref:KH domain-containing protein n=1 Tax=Methanogenium cariaci TaxID=2197 RepID=UPI000784A45D|nr:KH domain-containing protein [Methanogenium cariaci]